MRFWGDASTKQTNAKIRPKNGIIPLVQTLPTTCRLHAACRPSVKVKLDMFASTPRGYRLNSAHHLPDVNNTIPRPVIRQVAGVHDIFRKRQIPFDYQHPGNLARFRRVYMRL